MDRIFISDVTWEVIVNCVHVHIYIYINMFCDGFHIFACEMDYV